jgi:hypothetical protein
MLATLADLSALGAVPIGTDESSDLGARAVRLLELASASVASYARTTETLIDAWSDEAKTTLAAITAEIAARRLTSPAAPTSEQLLEAPSFMSMRLTRSDKAALDEIAEVVTSRRAARPSSVGATRSNSWTETIGVNTEDTFT